MHWPLRGGGPVYGRMVLAWAVLRVLCRIGTVTGTAALYSKRLKDIKVVLQTCMHHALYIYLGSVESPFCKVRAVVRPRLAQRTRTVHGRARGTCCTVHQIGFSIGLRAASGSLQNFWAFGAKAHARPCVVAALRRDKAGQSPEPLQDNGRGPDSRAQFSTVIGLRDASARILSSSPEGSDRPTMWWSDGFKRVETLREQGIISGAGGQGVSGNPSVV